MSHTIRLHAFWDIAEVGGRAVHSRNFGKPRFPDPRERVWLVCSHLPSSAEVRLNGELIDRVAQDGPFAADLTARLRERNTISFTLPGGESPGDSILEIRPPAS
jgi:hypothetical protein